MNAADSKLLLTNVEKHEAQLAGLNFNDSHVFGNGFQIRKEDQGAFLVHYRRGKKLKSRTFYSFQSALDFCKIKP